MSESDFGCIFTSTGVHTLETKFPNSRSLHRPVDDGGVGIVVGEDLLKRGAILGHGLGTGLTESHGVCLASTGEDEAVAVFCFGEVVAGDGGPSKTANDVDSSTFIKGVEVGDCPGGDTGGPANRVRTAMWTFDGVIRVVGGRKVKLGRGVRASAATAGVHGGERLGIVSDDEAVRGGDGVRGRTRGWRRFAQELAVRGVAEIELVVPGASGHEVRADRYIHTGPCPPSSSCFVCYRLSNPEEPFVDIVIRRKRFLAGTQKLETKQL